MMKKTIAALLAALFMLSLAACGAAAPDATDAPTATAEPTAEASAEPTAEPTHSATAPADAAALKTLLDEIEADVHPGTAGSSLTETRCAAELLTWGAATELSESEIRAAVVEWMTDKGNDELVAFSEQLAGVNDACGRLLADDVSELLSDAGCADMERTWGTEPVAAVGTVMTAVGIDG